MCGTLLLHIHERLCDNSFHVADNLGPVKNVNTRKILNTITNWENMREEELLILCFYKYFIDK